MRLLVLARDGAFADKEKSATRCFAARIVLYGVLQEYHNMSDHGQIKEWVVLCKALASKVAQPLSTMCETQQTLPIRNGSRTAASMIMKELQSRPHWPPPSYCPFDLVQTHQRPLSHSSLV